MEKINFIGAYDKTDSIMYIAKILTEMKKKVIIVDATITQKSKYVIPTVENKNEYKEYNSDETMLFICDLL